MRIIKTLGAAFLLVGTGGAILSFGAYNDNNFSYRSDGMIMINGEVFYPVGVYFIPLPDQRIRGPAENPPEVRSYTKFGITAAASVSTNSGPEVVISFYSRAFIQIYLI